MFVPVCRGIEDEEDPLVRRIGSAWPVLCTQVDGGVAGHRAIVERGEFRPGIIGEEHVVMRQIGALRVGHGSNGKGG